ncbi:unnamed protein product [Cunninghamella blakesleeana]
MIYNVFYKIVKQPTLPRIHHTHCLFSKTTIHEQLQRQYFDSYSFVKRLENKGFSKDQSCAVMSALQSVISENMKSIADTSINRIEYEKAIYTSKVDLAQLKHELQFTNKNEYLLMKAENDRLQLELVKIKQRLHEEIIKTSEHAKIEMHLEKSRFRDEFSNQKIKIEESLTHTESEMANIRTQMETTKLQIVQYFIGVLTGGGALFLAYLRMLS